MKRPHIVRLRDMLENIDAVADMIADAELATYQREVKLRRAVERCIEIVSEASRRLPRDLTSRHQDQPWTEIAAFGNLLRHEYQRVDDVIMWKIATRSLPALRAAVVEMLDRAGK